MHTEGHAGSVGTDTGGGIVDELVVQRIEGRPADGGALVRFAVGGFADPLPSLEGQAGAVDVEGVDVAQVGGVCSSRLGT